MRSPGESCSVSPTLAVAVEAALWAARRSDGLVDPTLVRRAGGRRLCHLARRPATAEHRRRLGRGPRARGGQAARGFSLARDLGRHRCGSGDQARPASASIQAAVERGSPRTWPRSALAATRTFVVDAGGDLRLGGERPTRAPGPHRPSARRRARPRVPARPRSSGDERDQDPPLAHGKWLRPSPPRPIDRASRLDRPDPGDLTRHTTLEAETLAKMAFLSGAGGRARDSLRARWSDRP